MPFSMVVVFDVSWRDATVLLSERHNYADRMVVVSILISISMQLGSNNLQPQQTVSESVSLTDFGLFAQLSV
jgi:hypothetical protein